MAAISAAVLLDQALRDVAAAIACRRRLQSKASRIPRYTDERVEDLSFPAVLLGPAVESSGELDAASRADDDLVAPVTPA